MFANCYIGEDGAGRPDLAATFTNCVCSAEFSENTTSKGGSIENRPCRFGSKWRPVSDDSAVVNAGDYVFYTSKFPVALLAYRSLDYAGNPRVLDDFIDIGATEYKPIGTTFLFR